MNVTEKRALIVDDDATTCELIEHALTSMGMNSLTVTRSEEAPEILRHARFAVAFLDHHMNFPDGPALARQMRASGSNRLTPIVLISDDQRPDSSTDCPSGDCANASHSPSRYSSTRSSSRSPSSSKIFW